MRCRAAVGLLLLLFTVGATSTVEATTPTGDGDGDGVTDDEDAYPDDPAYTVPLTVTIQCHEMGDPVYDPEVTYWSAEFVIDRVTLDFAEAWTTPFPEDAFCDVAGVNGSAAYYVEEPVTPLEHANWAATDPQYHQYTLGIAYSQCVEHGTIWTTQEWPLNAGQAGEAVEALAFCPGHPDRASIDERIAAAGVEQAERDEGVRFGPGLLRVGVDVQPGTYVAESDTGFESCYWERQDSSGEIIDNFHGQVFRTEVTIASTDYAFLSEGCGEWQLLG